MKTAQAKNIALDLLCDIIGSFFYSASETSEKSV